MAALLNYVVDQKEYLLEKAGGCRSNELDCYRFSQKRLEQGEIALLSISN